MKQKIIAMLILAVGLVSSNVIADPVLSKPSTTLHKKVPLLKLKPNLTARDLGWSGEFCNLSKCKDEFKRLGFNKATCRFAVRVINEGPVAAGRFRVKLEYRDWKGVLRRQVKLVTGLRATGLGRSKLVYFNIGYYKLNQHFKVTVDSLNQVRERNESDNVKYYRITY